MPNEAGVDNSATAFSPTAELPERARTTLDSWAGFVRGRLMQHPEMPQLDRDFLQVNLYLRQLALLEQLNGPFRTRFIRGMDQKKLWTPIRATGVEVASPAAGQLPDKEVTDQLGALIRQKNTAVATEFENWVVDYLQETGQRLEPPQNLVELCSGWALQRIAAHTPPERAVDLPRVLAALERGSEAVDRPLNELEQEAVKVLAPPTTEPADSKRVRFPASLSAALQYVYNRAYLKALVWVATTYPEKIIGTPADFNVREFLEKKLGYRPASATDAPESVSFTTLVAQIEETFRLIFLPPGQIRDIKLASLKKAKVLGGQLSGGLRDCLAAYESERFNPGQLEELYKYPESNDLLASFGSTDNNRLTR